MSHQLQGLYFSTQKYNSNISSIIKDVLGAISGGHPTVDDYRSVSIKTKGDGLKYIYYNNDELGFINEKLVKENENEEEKLLIEFAVNKNSSIMSNFYFEVKPCDYELC